MSLRDDELPLDQLGRIQGLVATEEGRQLADLAAGVPTDQAIVEIGSHRGLSSAWLVAGSQAGHRAHVTCIDPWPLYGAAEEHRADVAWGELGAMEQWATNLASIGGWPLVTPLRSTAVAVAATWAKPVGLLFHDADHAYESLRDDYLAWLPYLAPGAWVAVHDYYGNAADGDGGWVRNTATDTHQAAVEEVLLASGRWDQIATVGTPDGPVLPNLWFGRRLGP